jgi:hypothetical protein
MLRTYRYNSNNDDWIEEQHELLFHDICAIFDDNTKKIFLWKGPKSSKYSLEKGIKSLNNLLSSFQDFELVILKNDIPIYIKEKLNTLLESVEIERNLELYEFTHFLSIRIYLIVSLVILITFGIYLINLWSVIIQPSSSGNIIISADSYQQWLYVSKILLITISICLGFLLALSIYEYEVKAIILSSIGLIISISMVIYLQQGIFLFLFQSGSDLLTYLIKRTDILFFLILLTLSTMVYFLPSMIKLIYFIKTYRDFIF